MSVYPIKALTCTVSESLAALHTQVSSRRQGPGLVCVTGLCMPAYLAVANQQWWLSTGFKEFTLLVQT